MGLADWKKTDRALEVSNVMIFYQKYFSRGDVVVLGGSSGASCMYTVAIKEK